MENLTFEQAIKKLTELVSELESGNIDLEESVKKYNEGMKLSKYCNDLLKEANESIKNALDDNSNVSVVEKEEIEEDSDGGLFDL